MIAFPSWLTLPNAARPSQKSWWTRAEPPDQPYIPTSAHSHCLLLPSSQVLQKGSKSQHLPPSDTNPQKHETQTPHSLHPRSPWGPRCHCLLPQFPLSISPPPIHHHPPLQPWDSLLAPLFHSLIYSPKQPAWTLSLECQSRRDPPRLELSNGFPWLFLLRLKDLPLSNPISVPVPLTHYPVWLCTCSPLLHSAWQTPEPSSPRFNATVSKKPPMISFPALSVRIMSFRNFHSALEALITAWSQRIEIVL